MLTLLGKVRECIQNENLDPTAMSTPSSLAVQNSPQPWFLQEPIGFMENRV